MKILNKEGKEIDKIDLGILEAGKTKTYTYTVYNETEAEVIDIKFVLGNKEVTVIKSPQKMYPKGKDEITLQWAPSLSVKKGLKTTIKLTGTELYR